MIGRKKHGIQCVNTRTPLKRIKPTTSVGAEEGGAWQKIAVISCKEDPATQRNVSGGLKATTFGTVPVRTCISNHVTKQWESWNEYNVVTYNIPRLTTPGCAWLAVGLCVLDITYGVDWALGPSRIMRGSAMEVDYLQT